MGEDFQSRMGWRELDSYKSRCVDYRLSHETIYAPEISDADIKLKRETYTPRRFANEVEGEFFAGSTKPLTFADVLESIDANRGITKSVAPPETCVMGVDWGRETTVVIMNPKNGDILNALKLDSREEG